jgi:hypothetical protein
MDLKKLKRAAKAHSRATGCTHAQALDHIAVKHGYRNWSQLAKAAAAVPKPTARPATSGPPTVDDMVEWFRGHHTLAVESSPWDSAEGGYLWPLVDETDGVRSILEEEFPGANPLDIIEAEQILDGEGPWIDPEWEALEDDEAA